MPQLAPEEAALHGFGGAAKARAGSLEERSLEADRLLARATALEAGSAEAIIKWAVAEFPASGRDGSPLIMTSSFGAQSAVLLHLVATHAPGVPVVFLDTGYLFEETYRFVATMEARLGVDVRAYSATQSTARQEALYGKLWEQGAEGVEQYLHLNKVEPMQRALDELGVKAWLAGLRADQSRRRSSLKRFDLQDGRLKIHPILHWSDDEVGRYLKDHALPVHPLVSQGYRSIGDVHSTLPTVAGQHPREGRILGKAQECGIHLTAEENRSLTSSKL